MTVNTDNIAHLDEMVASLPAEEKELFQRIYAVTVTIGEQNFPANMEPWLKRQFGSLSEVARQKIVRVTNKVTHEEAIFNRVRALRPIEVTDRTSIDALIEKPLQHDPFSCPEENTPEDFFSRVVGKHCVTASNVAKFDGLHSLVIFNEFNPLNFSQEQIIDYLSVAWAWAQRASTLKPQAKYFCLIWNCLWRAAASIVHGHMQVMLTSERHYAKVNWLRSAALEYQQRYGSNYFTDLYRVHCYLGCALEKNGVKVLANLTPFKDNEIMLLGKEIDLSLKKTVYEVLACSRDKLGITSFNFSLVAPPLTETEESWDGFPTIVRLVDRGNLHSRASDIGGLEIYASSVVASDPIELTRQVRQYLDWTEVLGG